MSDLTGDALLRQKQREANDIIRVHNPTSDDYVVHWGKADVNTPYIIPKAQKDDGYGRGNRDVPRYIARKFIKEMSQKLMNRKAKKTWDKIYEDRDYKPSDYVAKEEERAIGRILKDKELWSEMRSKCLVGLVRKHGDDLKEPEPFQPENTRKSEVDKMLEEIPTVDELDKKKQKLTQEIAQ